MRQTPPPRGGMEGPAPGVTPDEWQARKARLDQAEADLARLRRELLGPRGGQEPRGLRLEGVPDPGRSS